MRYVTEPTIIGNKLLRKNRNVMVPYRQLHFSQDAWGKTVYKFDAERFYRDKELAQSPSFRPFGGGQHLCPGRLLAKNAVFSFIALALSRYEICLDDGLTEEKRASGHLDGRQRFPRPDVSKPGLGTMAPVTGDEVILQIRSRTSI